MAGLNFIGSVMQLSSVAFKLDEKVSQVASLKYVYNQAYATYVLTVQLFL